MTISSDHLATIASAQRASRIHTVLFAAFVVIAALLSVSAVDAAASAVGNAVDRAAPAGLLHR